MARDIQLSVPARPSSLQILRAVVAAGASRTALGLDSIEDLRIAVDEAAARLLRIAASDSLLNLRAKFTDDRIELEVWTDAEVEEWPPTRRGDSIGWQLIRGLTDDASYYLEEGKPGISMKKRVI